jgi:hypothetical protein
MAPITVTSSPRLGWARAPTSWILRMTASTSSSVAVCFITIIMRSLPFRVPEQGTGGEGARPEAREGEPACPRGRPSA